MQLGSHINSANRRRMVWCEMQNFVIRLPNRSVCCVREYYVRPLTRDSRLTAKNRHRHTESQGEGERKRGRRRPMNWQKFHPKLYSWRCFLRLNILYFGRHPATSARCLWGSTHGDDGSQQIWFDVILLSTLFKKPSALRTLLSDAQPTDRNRHKHNRRTDWAWATWSCNLQLQQCLGFALFRESKLHRNYFSFFLNTSNDFVLQMQMLLYLYGDGKWWCEYSLSQMHMMMSPVTAESVSALGKMRVDAFYLMKLHSLCCEAHLPELKTSHINVTLQFPS